MERRASRFEFVTHEPHQSQRQRELAVSCARAHAARVSFRPWYGHETRIVAEQADRTSANDQSSLYTSCNVKAIATSPSTPESDIAESARAASLPSVTHDSQPAFDPWQMSFGHRVDPFRCLPGSDERLMVLALDFFYSVMLNSFNSSNQANEVINLWSQYLCPLMSTFEPLFHVVMAIIFEGYDRVTRMTRRQVSVWREVFLQKHKAISKLRARLSEADAVADETIILTMLYLSLLDKGLGESEAQVIHQKQAMTMIEARGGPVSLKSELFAAALAQLTESSVDSTGVFPGEAALNEQSLRSNRLNVVYSKMMGRRYDTDISNAVVAVA